jgi:drug/metabolite transporter (DMT)-like permease
MPIFTGLFVSFADRTRIALSTLVALGLGILGAGVLAGPTALHFGNSSSLAMLAVVMAAASLAAAAVYSRLPLRTTDPVSLSAVKFLFASVIIIPAVAFNGGVGGFSGLGLSSWLRLLGLGVITTAVVRCGYVWVISVSGSVSASLLTYIVPAAALVLGLLFMGETMNWTKGMGVTLIAASVTCVLFGGMIVSAIGLPRVPAIRRANQHMRVPIGHSAGDPSHQGVVLQRSTTE